MGFEIPVGYKFACVALDEVSRSNNLSDPLHLGDGLWVLFAPPLKVSETWREWLGSIQAQRFSNSNLLFFSVAPSNQPGIIDQEHEKLKQGVLGLFYALLLHGVPYVPPYGGALWLLSGSNQSGTPSIQGIELLPHFDSLRSIRYSHVDDHRIQSTATVATGLRTIYANEHEYSRVKRGVHAWVMGMQEIYLGNRIYQFVRAVEALVKPGIGTTKRQFIHRCQLFAGRSIQARELLGELYDLRSCAEHMNDWEDIIKKNHPTGDLDYIGKLRVFQAELLASSVYRRILEDPNLTMYFFSDDSIIQFWGKRDDEQINLWGRSKTINLESEGAKRFAAKRFAKGNQP